MRTKTVACTITCAYMYIVHVCCDLNFLVSGNGNKYQTRKVHIKLV